MDNFGRALRLLVMTISLVLVACAHVASTSSAPEDREKMLSSSRCGVNYNRLERFVENFPPGPQNLMQIHFMYRKGYLGVRGYDTLGDLYYHGCSPANLAPSRAAAAMWYEYAAIGHVAEAQYKFGRMLFRGDGVPEDKELGIQWMTSAAIEGNVEARRLLQELGVTAPPAIKPNTYEILEVEHKTARRQERADWFKGAAGDVLDLSIVAVTAVACSASYVAAAQGSYTPPGHSTQHVVIQRYAPSFCSSTSNVMVTGGAYSAFANGTTATFCH